MKLFDYLQRLDELYWHLGFMMVIIPGLYFSVTSKFFQFKTLFQFKKCVKDLQACSKANTHGISPLRLYFASVGGMIGLGNVVAIITSILIGGPGALLWLWVSSFLGMLIKYSEIYLGIKYRVKNNRGYYDGGPMYFLRAAFKGNTLATVVAILLCVYGVEILQFTVIVDTLESTFHVNRYLAIGCLLLATFWTAVGGIKRLATVCTYLMPVFIISYVTMCLWVIGHHMAELPGHFLTVLHGAFNGHAALGGFAGSTFILTAQQGIAKGVYSGDIGIGFDSSIQAATKTQYPERQARMAIFSLITDSIVCTMSVLVVIVTGLWASPEQLLPSQYVAKALSLYFPYTDIFMGLLFFLAGFTTILAYYAVGQKCADFVSPKYGRWVYGVYAILAFSIFSFFDQTKASLIMSLTSGFLITINIIGMMKLRKEIKFQ